MARYALLLWMLLGWLLPSGVSMPLCACLIRPEVMQGCCAPAQESQPRSCCDDSSEEESRPECPCSVSTPDQDPGLPPLVPVWDVPAPAVLQLEPARSTVPCRADTHPVTQCARGPCRAVPRTSGRLPLRL